MSVDLPPVIAIYIAAENRDDAEALSSALQKMPSRHRCKHRGDHLPFGGTERLIQRAGTRPLTSMASNLSAREYVRAVHNAPRGCRLNLLRALIPFVFKPAPQPAPAHVCEFLSLEDYPSNYARLGHLLGRPEQVPASGEIDFLRSIQNRGLHWTGAIGFPEYFFLSAVASILAPVRAVEIGTSSGFSSAILAAALHRRHPQARRPLVDTIDLHSRYLVDQTKPIGFEIPELLPQLPDAVRVHTSRESDFVRELARHDELAFVFIDADHQHPSRPRFTSRGAVGWILLHDIQLGTMGVNARERGRAVHVWRTVWRRMAF